MTRSQEVKGFRWQPSSSEVRKDGGCFESLESGATRRFFVLLVVGIQDAFGFTGWHKDGGRLSGGWMWFEVQGSCETYVRGSLNIESHLLEGRKGKDRFRIKVETEKDSAGDIFETRSKVRPKSNGSEGYPRLVRDTRDSEKTLTLAGVPVDSWIHTSKVPCISRAYIPA